MDVDSEVGHPAGTGVLAATSMSLRGWMAQKKLMGPGIQDPQLVLNFSMKP